MSVRLSLLAFVTTVTSGTAALAEGEWLSVCGKCLSPSVTSKSGIGTANAVAEGRITRKDAERWCASWEPDRLADCAREQLASEDAKQSYRATADCTRGRITAIDGQTYTQAGVWTEDIGKGRTRWRDAGGAIVGQDNASNGLAISEQWEVLCPGPARAAVPAPPTASRSVPRTTPPPAVGAPFAVGDVVEAKYGRDWVRGKVTRVRQGPTAVEFDVLLENGQRGILPARMLRKVATAR
jgi:hypothetical protein